VSEGAADWKSSVEWLRHTLSDFQDPIPMICVLRNSRNNLSELLLGSRHGVRVIHENR
jgi:hypothetical protein